MREINEDSCYDIQHDDILNERLMELNINEVEFYKALEKRMPMKPIIQATDEKTHHKCQCGSIHITVYKRDGLQMGHKAKFCEWCGQAIDWNE